MLITLLLIQILCLIFATKKGLAWLFSLAIADRLSATTFSYVLIQLGPWQGSVINLWFAAIYAIQLIILIDYDLDKSIKLVYALLFAILIFFSTIHVLGFYSPEVHILFQKTLDITLKFTGAAFISFLFGQFVLLKLFLILKDLSFMVRYLTAICLGHLVDSCIFGILSTEDWVSSLTNGFILKCIFSLCFMPLVYYFSSHKCVNDDFRVPQTI
jgi:hypothetical protein